MSDSDLAAGSFVLAVSACGMYLGDLYQVSALTALFSALFVVSAMYVIIGLLFRISK